MWPDAPTLGSLIRMPLASIDREFPNWLGNVMTGPDDRPRPSELHPAFFGCFDWHSAVHSHWTLVRLLKAGLVDEEQPVREALDRHLTPDNLLAEAAYFDRPEARGFERPYGWTWLLKLAHELGSWDDPQGYRWNVALTPLTAQIVKRYVDWLPNLQYPVRAGLHGNTAFGLLFALDYARWCGARSLIHLLEGKTLQLFGSDSGASLSTEPQGTDFLSPALQEALLLSRVMPGEAFADWFRRFIPDKIGLQPVIVSDPSDGQISHLQGLNLSRAWSLSELGTILDRPELSALADVHRIAGLDGFDSGHYAGEHWLASFAMLALGF